MENGIKYYGEFFNNKKHGKGLLVSSDEKYKYDGGWENDLKHGSGSEFYPDNSFYIGEFSMNKKNGRGIVIILIINVGIYHLSNGAIYEGGFKNDKIEGYGKFIWTDNKSYEGEWIDNCLNGFGIFIKTGKIYIGYFVNDKKHGLGIYCYPNHRILIGKFFENEMEGLSIIINHSKEAKDSFREDKEAKDITKPPIPLVERMCFMIKSKVDVVINDENEKKNIKLSNEYKELIKFYEKNIEVIDKYVMTPDIK
jgi:hypothetical protein